MTNDVHNQFTCIFLTLVLCSLLTLKAARLYILQFPFFNRLATILGAFLQFLVLTIVCLIRFLEIPL